MARRPDVIRKQKDFNRLYKKGRSVGEKYVVVFFVANGLPYRRKALLASKKVGKSVVRNRARRLMRESYRHLQDRLPQGMDFLFVARNTIVGTKQQEVEASMERALKKGKILR